MAANALVLKALEHHRGGRLTNAEELYRQAIAADKRDFDALNLLGALMLQRGAFEEAIDHLRQAVKLRPANADALLRLAVAQRALGDDIRAEQSYRKVLQMAPNFAEAHFNFGNLLVAQGRVDGALAAYLNCIRLDPRHAGCHQNLGALLCSYGRFEPALAHFSAQQGLQPDSASAYAGLGRAYAGLRRFKEAVTAFERAVALDPADMPALTSLIATRQRLADWDGLAPLVDRLAAAPAEAVLGAPDDLIAILDDPALQLRAARDHVRSLGFATVPPPAPRKNKSRLRLAFLGPALADPDCRLFGMLEALDRSRYEVHAVTWGHDETVPVPPRLSQAVDAVHAAGDLADRQIAEKLGELGIHIAIDLAGLGPEARPGIPARRAAPAQVLLPGYAGTLGGLADYVLADTGALPEALAADFAEKRVALPHSVFPQAAALRPDDAPSREACGLPDGAFVFACFAGARKITGPVFGLWMGLLREIKGSLIWLAQEDALTSANLQLAAERAGIDRERLVFAAPAAHNVHLARLRYAQLMLDTTPDNAALAFGDALFAGVPGLACRGRSLAARRSAALLDELGLPELVAADLAELKQRALYLAGQPRMLKALRSKVDTVRKTAPAFDAAAVARMLEAAFEQMAAECPKK